MIFVSTDKDLIDYKWLTDAISGEYWGFNTTEERVREFCSKSLCFGIYERTEAHENGDESMPPIPIVRQLGFARVVTDTCTISLIGDVIIESANRAEGLGTRLMDTILGHPDVKRTACVLGTKNAWEFYEKFGFANTPLPMMQRNPL